jgi:hypothetical protein
MYTCISINDLTKFGTQLEAAGNLLFVAIVTIAIVSASAALATYSTVQSAGIFTRLSTSDFIFSTTSCPVRSHSPRFRRA